MFILINCCYKCWNSKPSQNLLVVCLLLSVSLGAFLSHLYSHAMGKQSSLTEVQRAHLVTLHGEGYTERDLADKLCYSKTRDSGAQCYCQTQC